MNYRKLNILKTACNMLPIQPGSALYLLDAENGERVVQMGWNNCKPAGSTVLLTYEEQEMIDEGGGEYFTCEDAIREKLYETMLYAVAYNYSPSPEGHKYVCGIEDSCDDECAESYWTLLEAADARDRLGADTHYIVEI